MNKEFVWDDKKVKEFLATFPLPPTADLSRFIDRNIEEFKASHTPEVKGVDWMVMALLAEDIIIKRDNYKPVAKTFDELYLENKCPIHSVRRYDGVVFSVDDNTDRGFVYSFEIAGNEMIATFKGNGGFSNINFLSKPLQRTPLFKTEDGVDIFEGMGWWSLFTNRNWELQYNNPIEHTHNPDFKGIRFSTSEAAKEYVILNKPCLSVNDVIKAFEDWKHENEFFEDYIKQFAKQKLDQQ